MIPFVGFCGGSYVHRHPVLGAATCVNWIPEPQAPGGKFDFGYVTRPGLRSILTLAPGPTRGWAEQNGRYFVVSGPTLYELLWSGSEWSAVDLGDVGTDGKLASLAFNGDQGGQLAVASAGNGFILTLSDNSFSQIADGNFPANVVKVVFWRGHFVWMTDRSTGFHLSDLYDGTAYSTADIGERQLGADYIKTIHADDNNELWLIGEQTSEPWWYNGALGFPAEPVNVLVPHGAAATHAWCAVGSSIYGLGQSKEGGRVILRYQSGYQPERISHHALDAALQSYSETQIARAVAFAFEWTGHRFFVLSIDDAATWVYDEATGLWHQWDFWDVEHGRSEAFLGLGHLSIAGMHVLGSRRDGTLYLFDQHHHYDNDDDVIRIERVGPYVHANQMRVIHNAIHFDFETGVGNSDKASPVAALTFSDDAGKTWSTERHIPLGALGEYGADCVLRQLGTSGRKGRLYRLVITDPVVRGLAGAYLDLGSAA